MDATRDQINQGEGGHGTHKERGKAPTNFRPLVEDWADFFRRATDLMELDLAMERGEVSRPTVRGKGNVAAKRKKERDQRIARSPLYQGRSPEFVAYLEGVSARTVQDARKASRLNPDTGLQTEKPLTAPARDQADAYANQDRALGQAWESWRR